MSLKLDASTQFQGLASFLTDGVFSPTGVRSVLIHTFDGTMVFRVYHDREHFTDYEIRHDDLSAIIDKDALAAFTKSVNTTSSTLVRRCWG